MKLLRYEGYSLTITEEALLLKPFKAIWDRDKSKSKDRALQEMGYIYFMEDSRSDYQTYIDRDERAKQIKLGEGMPESWKPDKLVVDAMAYYASFKTDAELLLLDLRSMVSNLRSHLKTMDLDAVDDRGKPIYNIDSYTKVVTDLNKLINSINETEKNITKDLVNNDKVRGSSEKSMFEDV